MSLHESADQSQEISLLNATVDRLMAICFKPVAGTLDANSPVAQNERLPLLNADTDDRDSDFSASINTDTNPLLLYRILGTQITVSATFVSAFREALLANPSLLTEFIPKTNAEEIKNVLWHLKSPITICYMFLNGLVNASSLLTLISTWDPDFDIMASRKNQLLFGVYFACSIAWLVATYWLVGLSSDSDAEDKLKASKEDTRQLKLMISEAVNANFACLRLEINNHHAYTAEFLSNHLFNLMTKPALIKRLGVDAVAEITFICSLAADIAFAYLAFTSLPSWVRIIMGVVIGFVDGLDSSGNQFLISQALRSRIINIKQQGLVSTWFLNTALVKQTFKRWAPFFVPLFHASAGLDMSVYGVDLNDLPGGPYGIHIIFLICMSTYGDMLNKLGNKGFEELEDCPAQPSRSTRIQKKMLAFIDYLQQALPVSAMAWYLLDREHYETPAIYVGALSQIFLTALYAAADNQVGKSIRCKLPRTQQEMSLYDASSFITRHVNKIVTNDNAEKIFRAYRLHSGDLAVFGLLSVTATLLGMFYDIPVLAAIGQVNFFMLASATVWQRSLKIMMAMSYVLASTFSYTAILITWFLNTVIPIWLSFHGKPAEDRPEYLSEAYFGRLGMMCTFLFFGMVGFASSFGDNSSMISQMERPPEDEKGSYLMAGARKLKAMCNRAKPETEEEPAPQIVIGRDESPQPPSDGTTQTHSTNQTIVRRSSSFESPRDAFEHAYKRRRTPEVTAPNAFSPLALLPDAARPFPPVPRANAAGAQSEPDGSPALSAASAGDKPASTFTTLFGSLFSRSARTPQTLGEEGSELQSRPAPSGSGPSKQKLT